MCAFILQFFLSKIRAIVVCEVMNTGGLDPGGGVIRALLGCGAGKGRVVSHVACRGEDTHGEVALSASPFDLLSCFLPFASKGYSDCL